MAKSIPETPSAPPALGPYSPAAEANGFLFLSGQIARDAAVALHGDAGGQARQVMEQIGAILRDMGLDHGHIVKTTIFLADMDDYSVVNEVYGSFFPEDPPARSAVQVARLPRDVAVEIEVVATR